MGFLIGCACGLLELILLVKLAAGMGKRGTAYTAAIFFVKVAVFGIAAFAVVLLAKQQLIWFAVGVSGVLILGSAAKFCKQAFGGGKSNV